MTGLGTIINSASIIAGAMEGMLKIENSDLSSGKSMLIVLCLAIGTTVGELMGIEKGFERFGQWLKEKTGNRNDVGFVNAFVTASLTVCIGAMAIVGAIQDGILNDYSTLAVKSVLDFIIVMVMTSSMGKGCAFSAIPVFDWFYPDFLCGSKSGLGQKNTCGQYAALCLAGNRSRIPALEFLTL